MIRSIYHLCLVCVGVLLTVCALNPDRYWWALLLLLLIIAPWDKGLDKAADAAIESRQLKQAASEWLKRNQVNADS